MFADAKSCENRASLLSQGERQGEGIKKSERYFFKSLYHSPLFEEIVAK
jgi:hypothetical protein